MPLLEVHKVVKVTATVTLEQHTAESLDKYAALVNASADVINKAWQFVFEKDKVFPQFLQSVAANAVPHSLCIKSATKEKVVEEQKPTPRNRADSLGAAEKMQIPWWRNALFVVGKINLFMLEEERCFASDQKVDIWRRFRTS